ncbi:glycosyltransferase family 2 protein, partial [Leuconostoc lactis]
MDNKVPFFSVILPMFNSEKYVGETLKSIIHQTFTDWELILVDD